MSKIYFDEAGATGSDLLHADQPHFVYAGVATSDLEAQALIDQIRAEHHIQAPELKGRQIVGRSDGLAIIKKIVDSCSERVFLFVADKEVALCGKLFDYTIEPVVFNAGVKDFFFGVGAHKYFLNHFYMIWKQGPAEVADFAAPIAREFQEAIRAKELSLAPTLFGDGANETGNGFLDDFLWFCRQHKGEIESEFQDVEADTATSRWVLEMTNAALYSVLTQVWHLDDGVDVIFDESKPISDYLPVLEQQLGSDEALDHVQSYQSGSSLSNPGIQLADVIASATARALKDPDATTSAEIVEMTGPLLVWGMSFDPSEIAPGPGTKGMIAYEALLSVLKCGGNPQSAVIAARQMISTHGLN